MSPFKFLSHGFTVVALFVGFPVFATDAQQQAAEASVACKQARQNLFFLKQLATTDGGTNPYSDAPTPAACKYPGQAQSGSSAKESRSAGKTAEELVPRKSHYN